jgi:GH35 family endo-1,4-beta-xylanase
LTETESKGKGTTRRDFLKIAAAIAGAAGFAAGYGLRDGTGHPPWSPELITTVTQTTTEPLNCSASLRAIAQERGFQIGSAVDALCLDSQHYGNAQIYANTLAREFNYVTPEYQMQWREVHPGLNDWNFALVDDIADFATDHQMKLKGHTLIWGYGSAIPLYLTSTTPNDEFRQIVENHVKTLVGRYKGKIHAWNVVNEAVDHNSSELRKTLFLEKMGDGYIAEAFHMAREADSDAVLLYNDYGAEGSGKKSDGVYRLVKKLVSDGVPIDGVGLQMHVGMDPTGYPEPEEIARNIRRLVALGLRVEISEMDVQIRNLPGSFQERLETQRKIYHDIIAACFKEKGFRDVTFWGFSDADSWIDTFFGSDDPLLFDDKFQPKPAYWGVMQALLDQ